MSRNIKKVKNSGFTLVELAIVIVVIGLLIGGVLQGQELINQAKIRSVVSKINEYNTAVNTFRAKYNNSIPGDFDKAAQFGIGQNLAIDDYSVSEGNNNGELESNSLNPYSQWRFKYEFKNFFVHLSNANLIRENFSQAQSNSIAGIAFPRLETGGGMIATTVKSKLYYLLAVDSQNLEVDAVIDEGLGDPNSRLQQLVLTPGEAYSIDFKTDDGRPNTGIIQSFSSFNGTTNVYPFINMNVGLGRATSDTPGDISSSYLISNPSKACMIYVQASS
jgi:prepilin-type N-terminal cleavage/methylation domain-containing protein